MEWAAVIAHSYNPFQSSQIHVQTFEDRQTVPFTIDPARLRRAGGDSRFTFPVILVSNTVIYIHSHSRISANFIRINLTSNLPRYDLFKR